MASPLYGVSATSSLLFAAYGQAKKIISPFPVLSLPQIALAGGAAGAINSLLASPVEMFKIRMQGTRPILGYVEAVSSTIQVNMALRQT